VEQSISCIDCSDLIAIEEVVAEILTRIYTFCTSNSAESFAQNIRNVGLLAIMPADYPDVHFVLCAGAETAEMFEKIKSALGPAKNWQSIKEHSQVLTVDVTEFTWRPVEGVKLDVQLRLVYLRLIQLLRVAAGPSSNSYPMIIGSLGSMKYAESWGHKLFAVLEP